MRNLIDWDLLAEMSATPGFDQAGMWDAFARRYEGYGRLQSEATRLHVQALGLRTDDSLLDVGAGAGRLSLAAARHVKRVTALDVSGEMLAALRRNAEAAGIGNVHPLHLSWRDAHVGDNLPVHDVVVAARSPATFDLRKLDAAARRAVYIMLFAGPSLKEFHDALIAGIESPPPAARARLQPSGHVLIFNRLAAMGIEASVNYVPDGFSQWYPDQASAIADFEWLEIPAAQRDRFRSNLLQFLAPERGGLRLRLASRSVMLWWTKAAPSGQPPLPPRWQA